MEGILNSEWYKDLFKLAVQLYGDAIAAYYFDLPFEETIKRHKTRVKSNEFGEAEMRCWWIEKDYASVLKEEKITSIESKEFIVGKFYKRVTAMVIKMLYLL
ncbi:hypothetical protein ACVRW4_00410 [Streptococcus phocae subsp. phocae]|uniref:hypothetical protein n=1 Tax=Streptococcus phocae TaxID=119224 RepID=UPI0006BC0D72